MKNILMIAVWLVALTSEGLQADSKKRVAEAHYVNMGSSFAAGSGIDPIKANGVVRCRQSAVNYASLLADRLNLTLEDRSCGGARSIHLLEPWNEIPPQINAVKDDTELVTITVGGNDLNYVLNLFAASCSEDEGVTIGGRKRPCFQEVMVPEETYAQLKSNLTEISKQISIRAPQAQIIFIQYVTLIPDHLCEAMALTEAEASRMRVIGKRLAAITAAAAAESDARLLNIDTLSIGHTACDAEPWSIGAATSSNNAEGMPWHPNRRANEIIANHLQKMVTTSVE